MKQAILNFISKKSQRHIDENIPLSFILLLLIEKVICLIRGILRTGKGIFIAKGVTLRQRKKISFGKNLRIEKNVTLDALSHNGIVFGNFCVVGKNTRIECSGTLSLLGKGFICGDNCGLGTDSFYGCAGGIKLGSDVIVGNFVSMHSENHNFADKKIPIRLQGVNRKGIEIGNNVWIGAKATILDGTIIGDGSIVAAGAVVKGTFPPNAVIGGVPAKVIKTR